jgi:hypothetical protein
VTYKKEVIKECYGPTFKKDKKLPQLEENFDYSMGIWTI